MWRRRFCSSWPDQRPAVEGAHRDEAHPAVGELEHLQRLGEFEQLGDVVADDLLGADRVVDREILGREDLGMRQVVGGADARDLGRDVEHRGGELARDHVGLVALRDGEQHVGVARAGLLQHRRVRGVAGHGAQIEAVLQAFQPGRVDVDDRDVVRFGDQVLGDRGADLSGAEYDDAHGNAILAACRTSKHERRCEAGRESSGRLYGQGRRSIKALKANDNYWIADWGRSNVPRSIEIPRRDRYYDPGPASITPARWRRMPT